MATPPAVSFIMPAFNAAPWIAEAINSVLAQSRRDWELIVVDDASTDKTPDIVGSFVVRDPRIRLIRLDEPSGSAYIPRKRGASEARTNLIAPLDADDAIGPDYLRNLLALRRTTAVETVYPTMYLFDGSDKKIHTPSDPGILERPLEAEELLARTFLGWKINCNGGLIPRDIFLQGCRDVEKFMNPSKKQVPSNFDEFLTRCIIHRTRRGALSPEPYLYRTNPESITRRPSLRQFDFLITDTLLCQWSEDKFGSGSNIYSLAKRQRFFGSFDALRLLGTLNWPASIRKEAFRRISALQSARDFIPSSREASLPYRLAARLPLRFRSYIVKGDTHIRNWRPMAGLRYRFRKLREALAIYRGKYLSPSEEYEFLNKFYPSGSSASETGSIKTASPNIGSRLPEGSIVCICDGRMYHGGPTDRLRGILTTYRSARHTGRPFYISWTSPFRLEDYLIPATFDWRIPSGVNLRNSREEAFPLVIQDRKNLDNSIALHAGLSLKIPELHVYSNADNARGEYAGLFAELFRPSEALEVALAPHLTVLGEYYWGISLRFVRLLGDFPDWIASPLKEEEAEALMSSVESKIAEILRILPEGFRMVVTSDSKRFLTRIADFDARIYVTPGDIRNVDLSRSDFREAWMKTFVDQQLLMKAKRVFLLRTGEMYPSGFPRFAAEVGEVPFTDICF